MKVWIVNPYGSLPDEAWREYRSAMLADAFARAGHDVVWWISGFEHRSKTFRVEEYTERTFPSGIKVRIVPTRAYRKHVSIARIRSERTFARNLVDIARQAPHDKPDMVVLAEPSIFYAGPIVKMAKKANAKLVADILDIWPEVFAMILPKPLRPLERLIFAPLYYRRASTLRACDGIVGVSEDYRLLGHKSAPSVPSSVSYCGVDVGAVREALRRESGETKAKLGLPHKAPGEVWVIYAGTLGAGYDIASILVAAASPQLANEPVRFLFAGDGPQRPLLEMVSKKPGSNVIYLGRLDPEDLNVLYKYCDIGLSTYLAYSTVSVPLKFFDYLAAGIATVNSLDREISRLIRDHELGMQYTPGDSNSLVHAIMTLVSDRERLARCKTNAAKLAPQFDQYLQHDAFVRFATTLQ